MLNAQMVYDDEKWQNEHQAIYSDAVANNVPDITADGIANWVVYGVHPGGFLTAVLQNKLMETIQRADSTNFSHIYDIVNFIYNKIPIGCWGSEERMEFWVPLVDLDEA